MRDLTKKIKKGFQRIGFFSRLLALPQQFFTPTSKLGHVVGPCIFTKTRPFFGWI
jgi:hypothetical protein